MTQRSMISCCRVLFAVGGILFDDYLFLSLITETIPKMTPMIMMIVEGDLTNCINRAHRISSINHLMI